MTLMTSGTGTGRAETTSFSMVEPPTKYYFVGCLLWCMFEPEQTPGACQG